MVNSSSECRNGGFKNQSRTFLAIFKVHGQQAIKLWPDQLKDIKFGKSTLEEEFLLKKAAYHSSLSSSINSLSTISSADSCSSRSDFDDDSFSKEISPNSRGANSYDDGYPIIRYKFRLASNNEQQTKTDEDNIKVFILEQPPRESDHSKFHKQSFFGQTFNKRDFSTFMTSPMDSSKVGVIAVDLSVSNHMDREPKIIGTAYLHIDPKNSTQGTQKARIIGTSKSVPIGTFQTDYLVVTDPIGYGQNSPLPGWLLSKQLDAGHRGLGVGRRADLSDGIVENTIASFNYAAKHGADMVELDVFVSNDGVPVVYHDFDMPLAPSALDTEFDIDGSRVQVDEFTVEQLQQFKVLALHQEGGEHYTLQIPGQPKMNRPFPTLSEVLDYVEPSCCMNIEIKWPQLLDNGKWQANRSREVNDFVDKILNCIMNHHNSRRIILSTFDADIAIMLRLKQNSFPVLFLTTGDSLRYNDPRTKTVKNGIHFAQAFELAGINPRSDNINQYLVRYAKDRDLLVYSWGNDINSPQVIKELKRIGLNGLIYDKIDLIKPKD